MEFIKKFKVFESKALQLAKDNIDRIVMDIEDILLPITDMDYSLTITPRYRSGFSIEIYNNAKPPNDFIIWNGAIEEEFERLNTYLKSKFLCIDSVFYESWYYNKWKSYENFKKVKGRLTLINFIIKEIREST